MEFKILGTAISKQFHLMSSAKLFRVDIEKELLWDTYLASFPAGSNPLYRERTEHDCQCCKSFVRSLGGVVAILDDGRLVSIWDVQVAEPNYQTVVDAMAALVRDRAITNLFLHPEPAIGVSSSRQLLVDQSVKTWDHFFVNLPTTVVCKGVDIGPRLADSRATHDVMLRGLTEIPLDAIDTVLELIAQNSLYRGEEQQFAVNEWRKLKVQFDEITGDYARDLFVWARVASIPPSVSRIRNTAIGTLLVDLAAGTEMEDAVRSFETKVAPTNYKRPTALVTKAMIARAQEKVNELGFASALERRYAVIEDITINNVLFADRQAKKDLNVFDALAEAAPENLKRFSKVQEVGIADFLEKILPQVESVEVLVENRHAGNMVSLIAPTDPTARQMFKWPNNFSWSYAGDLADSIKERVKRAGGSVDGDFRASLSWRNYDDLDLHLVEPDGTRIYFRMKRSAAMGELDVDMNAGGGTTREPVENITYPRRDRMQQGIYRLEVNQFCQREASNPGFDVEMEFAGSVYSFAYAKPLRTSETVVVAKFKVARDGALEIIESLPASQTSRMIWGVPTQAFRRVNVVMLSPNHWDGRATGNRHYFFMLDGCRNAEKARGFFNEFLTEDLAAHRKVLEVVGAKMKTDESERQLSGLGFSSTQRNSVLCQVKGSFTRAIKVLF